ncbi:MAG: YdeI family protein [Kordia sp.]|uniref:YdeI/OmpD-associated family protein n=1 Tax=Kordia sp. TaxID=1965332 RepID=UPI0038584A54
MKEREELYFKNDIEWRTWLEKNHETSTGVYLIFYKVSSATESMRWEEAVKVALCFGWIDSTVKRLDDERRRQYFCPRKPKSVWSKLNKTYLVELIAKGKMHESGSQKMIAAIKDGSWTALDDVENLIVPKILQAAFDKNPIAYKNYQNFSPSYRKSYLYWLNQAKREATREKRITEIIRLCEANIKSRDT